MDNAQAVDLLRMLVALQRKMPGQVAKLIKAGVIAGYLSPEGQRVLDDVLGGSFDRYNEMLPDAR